MNDKILIVEDSESTRRALKVMLELHNYEVVGDAKDGEEGIAMYQNSKPDLVLMDIAMPKKHGIDAIREIKVFDSKAKIIAITALYSSEKKTRALNVGAAMVIEKPINVPDLIKAMESVLGNQVMGMLNPTTK